MKMFALPNHIGFEALKLFGKNGNIIDGSLAYIQPGGGGPIELHTHAHDHLFAVIEGEAKILLDKEVIVIKKGESFLVDGRIPHSVWNNFENQTVMIGINLNKCVKSE